MSISLSCVTAVLAVEFVNLAMKQRRPKRLCNEMIDDEHKRNSLVKVHEEGRACCLSQAVSLESVVMGLI